MGRSQFRRNRVVHEFGDDDVGHDLPCPFFCAT
jgi:hypothetical protein